MDRKDVDHLSPEKHRSLGPISPSRANTSRAEFAAMADAMLRSPVPPRNLAPAPSDASSLADSSGSRTLLNEAGTIAASNIIGGTGKDSLDLDSVVAKSLYNPARSPQSTQQSSSSFARSSRGAQKMQLQNEIRLARAQVNRGDTKELFNRMCSTDLLFLLDTTNSMKPYIDAVKQQVRDIVAEIQKTFFGESEVRVAIVSYKDHQCDPNIEFLDFTTSVDVVYSFLDRLEPDWGRDFPEDVLGGLQQALNASWRQQNRCMVHIGDAPPHGQSLHDFTEREDNFFTPGSEPHGLTYQSLLERLVKMNITYAFLNIEAHTDRMALCFALVYGANNSVLLSSNQYFAKILDKRSERSSDNRNISSTRPQFEELNLGVTYSELSRLVLKTVTSSFARTAGRFTMARSGHTDRTRSGALDLDSKFAGGIKGVPNSCLETDGPEWDDLGWFDVTLDMNGFLPAETYDSSTLQKMLDSDDNIVLTTAENLVVHMRSKPFAHGAIRFASYARTDASESPFVIKSFIKKKLGRVEAIEDMRTQALCKAFALEFNGLLPDIEPPLDFVVTSCLQRGSKGRQSSSTKSDECFTLEPFIPGDYVKYNGNNGYVKDDPSDAFNLIAQAFSHFTFERSWGHLLVNDLQGVGHLLTDPAVQSKSVDRFQLSVANMNEGGIKMFFVYHECNDYCTKLGLKSNRDMFQTGEFDFRDTWPALEPTVCCSNKFCNRIIRLAQSNESEDHPGHQWCDNCFPQLKAYTTGIVCEASDDMHEFELSRFFYESQGRTIPFECPEHRKPDREDSTIAAL